MAKFDVREKINVGIVAPSSVVPKVEFKLGLEKLKKFGLEPHVHPQVKKRLGFYAGSDAERAEAFLEAALSPDYSVVWCARGGYGATQVLPILDRLAGKFPKPPRKLLVGYSDSVILQEYVKRRWGWSILHANMPGIRSFLTMEKSEDDALETWIREWHARSAPSQMFLKKLKLKFLTDPPKQAVSGKMFGGNLSLWASMRGTPFAPPVLNAESRDTLLFFEDITESLCRIDRMVQQLYQSGTFQGVGAIVLGNFLQCNDAVASVLKSERSPVRNPKPSQMVPLRPSVSQQKALKTIFGGLGEFLNIPVAYGMPVGHGPEHAPLPLGADYRIKPDGRIELLSWE